MTANKVWLEAALNGPWGRELQPGIPVSVKECIEEGVACAEAGAAIIHVHAYEKTGEKNHDAGIYRRIIEGIRNQTDAIVYPSIPAMGLPDVSTMTGKERFAHQDELGEENLIEWAVVDPGSVNFSKFGEIKRDETGSLYRNPEEHIRTGLEVSSRHDLSPAYAIYEPGFIRLGAALAERYPGIQPPIYRFMFSDDYTFGYPPREYALDSYVTLLESEAPEAPWMVSGLGVDITPLIPATVKQGGHVRVGLEDAPLGTERGNVELVETARREIETSGGILATASEVRDELAEIGGV